MKKVLILLAGLTLIFMFNNIQKEDYIIIPNDSIRFRIIPNSNTPTDLLIKEKVKEEITDAISNIEKSEDINETRKSIVENIPLIETQISSLFEKENYDKEFKINYGMNHFPEKIYKGVKYEEGDYESMVIEIGDSVGDNYWCVLFPPLCLIDAEESEEVEYKFFITEILKKFFN